MVRLSDGVVRPLHNPRSLSSLTRRMGRRDIVDRNGLPLATSRYDEVTSKREQYSCGVPFDSHRTKPRLNEFHH